MSAWSAAELVRRHARGAGDQPALIDGPQAISWADLDRRLDAAALALEVRGVHGGDLVALLPGAAIETVTAVLAAQRLGAVAAPIPAGLTGAELDVAAEVLGPALVIDPAALCGDGTAPRLAEPGPSEGHPDLEAPALVILTSGTTGRPKGVVLSGAALAASADAWLGVLPPATGWLLCVALAHVAGLGLVWRAIRDAVPVHVAPSAESAAQLAALRASPAVSHVSLVPAQLARLLDAASADGAARPPGTLRSVLLGGGPIPPPLVRRALASGWPVVPTYGLSEAGSGVTALATAEAAAAPGSAGRALPGVTVWIDQAGPDGVGEIVVTTPAGFSGYLGDPPRRRDAPIRSGDLGRIDDAGRLYVEDRRVDRIVRGGENVSPAEVEAVLEAHPAVAEAAVVGRPDPRWGQEPVAAIVLRPGTPDPGDTAIIAHCRASLAGFKVPAAVVRLDALPRTRVGKLRREAIRALLDGSRTGELARPGGDRIGWRLTGDPGDPADPATLHLLLLPGTLSTARQLDRLAAEIARPGDVMVHALDRRGSGTARRVRPGPVDVAVHVDDIRAYLDARGIAGAAIGGHSFGGALALEAAARLPGRILAVVAYEPPYGPVADEPTRARFATTAERTRMAHQEGGAALAAETFVRIVAGDRAWDSLPERTRAALSREGDGALTDSALSGLDAAGLHGIRVPARILTGGASQPFYPRIAEALVARIPGATEALLAGLTHNGPITDAPRVAAAVRRFLAESGLLSSPAGREKQS